MGRGGRLDAHGRHLYLSVRLACEVADSRRDFQARAQDARDESLALRRVVPSPKERRRVTGRSIKVLERLRKRDIVFRYAREECASVRLRESARRIKWAAQSAERKRKRAYARFFVLSFFDGFHRWRQCLASSGCGPRRPIAETASRAARSSASREKENTSAFSTMREGVADLGRGRMSCSRQ